MNIFYTDIPGTKMELLNNLISEFHFARKMNINLSIGTLFYIRVNKNKDGYKYLAYNNMVILKNRLKNNPDISNYKIINYNLFIRELKLKKILDEI